MDKKIAVKWNDGTESFINNKTLRKKCPCANCSGESDVFGNIYKSKGTNMDDPNKYKIVGYINVGHYAIRIFWSDGHSEGLYTFDMLRKISN